MTSAQLRLSALALFAVPVLATVALLTETGWALGATRAAALVAVWAFSPLPVSLPAVALGRWRDSAAGAGGRFSTVAGALHGASSPVRLPAAAALAGWVAVLTLVISSWSSLR